MRGKSGRAVGEPEIESGRIFDRLFRRKGGCLETVDHQRRDLRCAQAAHLFAPPGAEARVEEADAGGTHPMHAVQAVASTAGGARMTDHVVFARRDALAGEPAIDLATEGNDVERGPIGAEVTKDRQDQHHGSHVTAFDGARGRLDDARAERIVARRFAAPRLSVERNQHRIARAGRDFRRETRFGADPPARPSRRLPRSRRAHAMQIGRREHRRRARALRPAAGRLPATVSRSPRHRARRRRRFITFACAPLTREQHERRHAGRKDVAWRLPRRRRTPPFLGNETIRLALESTPSGTLTETPSVAGRGWRRQCSPVTLGRIMKKVLLLNMGGTLGMQGSPLSPGDYAHRLIERVPELSSLAELEIRSVCNLDSSDVGPEQWSELVQAVADRDGSTRRWRRDPARHRYHGVHGGRIGLCSRGTRSSRGVDRRPAPARCPSHRCATQPRRRRRARDL